MKDFDRKMKHLTALWLSVFLTTAFDCVPAQPGFLSLDCGALAPYVDDKGISWTPDDPYISGGSTQTLAVNVNGDLKSLRYFPDSTRKRYCYSIPTIKGQTYLLRNSFYHGNYDPRPNVVFEVGVDIYEVRGRWEFNATTLYLWGETYFQAFKDNIQLCLYRLSPSDNPFISSIELRPMDPSMYAIVKSGSCLGLQGRLNLGTLDFLRYPDDSYDRYWLGSSSDTLVNISASSVLNSGLAVDKPPPAVMNTAVTTVSVDPYIYYKFQPSSDPTKFYMINIFLAELEVLNTSRVINFLVNGEVVAADVNVYSRALNALYKPIELSTNKSTPDADGQLNITLSKSALSGAPPIWNAFEVFTIYNKQVGTVASDVTAIEGMKKAFGLEAVWTGDPCLSLPYDWLNCSAASPPRVTGIELASANLSGPIPDLRALTSLTSLRLQNNSLTGSIPDWLGSMPNLQELDLQNNNLTGNVPEGLLKINSLRLEGNSGLCLNTTCATGGKKSSSVGIIIGVVAGVLFLVAIVIGVVLWKCCGGRAQSNKADSPALLNQLAMEEGTTRGSRYTLAQVTAATKNYAKVLGKGGFGPVYYGKLASGQEVAVKVAAKGSGQGSKEFINEVELLTRVHHKNLVSLVGFCDEGDQLILLYEYMSQGTVQAHLYGVGEQQREFFLDWKTRLRIALNSAQGLEYLHVGCQPVIYHRDVKSNNILLNDKLIAKVADFGLSKSTDSKENVTHMSTMVKGTIGYLDPEYFISNQLTDKSDVYGFGIVLLELICARPPFQPQLPEDQRRIDQWVRPFLQAGTIEEIVDPALAGHYNLDAMWKVADLAMQSVEPKGKHRPNMSTVVQELRAAIDMEQEDSSANFQFDLPHSNTSSSDPNIVASSTVNAR